MSAKERFSRFKVNGPRAIALVIAVAAILAPLAAAATATAVRRRTVANTSSRSSAKMRTPHSTTRTRSCPSRLRARSSRALRTSRQTQPAWRQAGPDTAHRRERRPEVRARCDLPTGELDPGDSTSVFDNMTVEGEWTVRVPCTNAALLDEFAPLARCAGAYRPQDRLAQMTWTREPLASLAAGHDAVVEVTAAVIDQVLVRQAPIALATATAGPYGVDVPAGGRGTTLGRPPGASGPSGGFTVSSGTAVARSSTC